MRIAALALLVAATLRAQDASPCNNTPAYSTCELVFELSEAAAARHPEPYKTVDLKAEFRSPAAPHAGPARLLGRRPADGGALRSYRGGRLGLPRHQQRRRVRRQDRQVHRGRLAFAGLHPSGERAPLGVLGARRARTLSGAPVDGRRGNALRHRGRRRHFAPSPMRAPRRSSTTCAASSAARAPMPHSRAPTRRTSTQFRRLDERIRYLNSKGITADLILAADGAALTKAFPNVGAAPPLPALPGGAATPPCTSPGRACSISKIRLDTRALLEGDRQRC